VKGTGNDTTKSTGSPPPFSPIPINTSYFTKDQITAFNYERALLNREYDLEVRKSKLYIYRTRIADSYHALSLQINNGYLAQVDINQAKQQLSQLNKQIDMTKGQLNTIEYCLRETRKALDICSVIKRRHMINR
jgi:hypothetical protein